jgi:hypothetical protein
MLPHNPQPFRLQFHQDSSYNSRIPCHGRWRHRSALEHGGLGSPLGSLRAVEGGVRSYDPTPSC